MNKVLVPIDGSEASLRALRRAMTFAGEIHVVNVQLPPDLPSLATSMSPEEIAREQIENGLSRLAPACKVLEGSRATFTSHVLIGAPASKLAEFAHQEGIDQIVMGAHGVGGSGSTVIGSTARKLLHLAGVPVSVVE
jgi:nucleotide-binding universal stress UspA family protein